MNLPGASDEDLLHELRSGSADALAELFKRHYRSVFSVAHRILQDWGEAEDLTQEVFLEVYRNPNKYDPARSSPKTWILQNAYHRGLSRRRLLG